MNRGTTIGCSAIFIIVALIAGAWFNYGTVRTERALLVEKVVEEGNTAFVFQFEDGHREMLVNDDSFMQWKFNSRDLVMNMQAGNTYTITYNGIRAPFLSLSKNLLRFK